MSRYVLLMILVAGVPVLASAQSDEMESIVAPFSTMEAFLSDARAVDRYVVAAQNYFGGRFTRENFDLIIANLRTKMEESPNPEELADRLWQPDVLGETASLQVDMKSRGLKLLVKPFRRAIKAWMDSLARAAGNDTGIAMVAQEWRAASVRWKDLRGAERKRAISQWLNALMGVEMYCRMMVGYLLAQLKRNGTWVDAVKSESPDIILEVVARLTSGRLFEIAHGATFEFDPELRPLIYDAVGKVVLPPVFSTPPLQMVGDQPARTSFFEVETVKTTDGRVVPLGAVSTETFVFKPVKRRFHALGKGLKIGECVATEARRFLSMIAEGTWLQFVERRGQFEGFIQIVPVSDGTRLYGSVDFVAPALRNTVVYSGGQESSLQWDATLATTKADQVVLDTNIKRELATSKMFEWWIDWIYSRISREWTGLIVSDSFEINNAQVLPLLFQSIYYKSGQNILGLGAQSLSVTDPLALGLGELVFDAGEFTPTHTKSKDKTFTLLGNFQKKLAPPKNRAPGGMFSSFESLAAAMAEMSKTDQEKLADMLVNAWVLDPTDASLASALAVWIAYQYEIEEKLGFEQLNAALNARAELYRYLKLPAEVLLSWSFQWPVDTNALLWRSLFHPQRFSEHVEQWVLAFEENPELLLSFFPLERKEPFISTWSISMDQLVRIGFAFDRVESLAKSTEVAFDLNVNDLGQVDVELSEDQWVEDFQKLVAKFKPLIEDRQHGWHVAEIFWHLMPFQNNSGAAFGHLTAFQETMVRSGRPEWLYRRLSAEDDPVDENEKGVRDRLEATLYRLRAMVDPTTWVKMVRQANEKLISDPQHNGDLGDPTYVALSHELKRIKLTDPKICEVQMHPLSDDSKNALPSTTSQ